MTVRTTGIVIRQRTVGETDKYITFLTDRLGVIEIYLKNAQGRKSKFSAVISPLCYSELVLFGQKNRYTLDEASLIDMFYDIRKDIVKLSLCSYLCELAEKVVAAGESATAQLKLLLNTVYFIKIEKYPFEQLKSIFELRLLSQCGYMPDLIACHDCGKYYDERFFFDTENGAVICRDCCKKIGLDFSDSTVSASTLSAMRHIIYSQPNRIFSFSLGADNRRELSTITEKYVLCQTERQFPSLDFWHML